MSEEDTPQNGDTPDMDSELAKVMAEAEAAVGGDAEDDGDLEIDDGAEDDQPDAAAELGAAKDRIADLKDKWLRAVADLENHKKRTKRELDEAANRTTQSLLKSFLPTVDNLERALEVSEAESDASSEERLKQLVTGIEMVRDEFLKSLAGHGIEPVPAVGHPFDPSFHDALQQVESKDYAPGVVVKEFEKGYVKGERLLRPARVIVAGPGSTGMPPDEQETES